MKNKVVIISMLILLASLNSFSQNSSIKGIFFEYETGYVLPGVTMLFQTHSGKKYRAYNDNNGIFELKMGDDSGDLTIRFLGCYAIKILNIPQGLKHIDLGEIKMIRNDGRPQFNMDGSAGEIPKELIEKDKNLRKEVLEKYRIKILGEELKPYFEGEYLVFDFNENRENK